jgi:prepilin signal peptidase PulO-like enzyme (type II secretory pathway)
MSFHMILPAVLRDCIQGTPDWKAIAAGVPGAVAGLAIALGSSWLARVLVPEMGEVRGAGGQFGREFDELGGHYAGISAATWSTGAGDDSRFLYAWGAWLAVTVLALVAALVSGFAINRFGLSARGVEAAVFCLVLLLLAAIDARHQLLPDLLTLPLMWIGLLINIHHGFVMAAGAIWGAVVGYALLRILALPAQLLGREVIGFGDFKLYAAIGAWLGVGALPQVFALSLVAATIGLGVTRLTGREPDDGLPGVGPYIAAAGIVTMLWGVWLDVPFLSVKIST